MNKERDFDIYETLIEINNEKNNLKKQIDALDYKKALLKLTCNHDLAIMLWDHESHKIGKINYIVCPICGNVARILPFTDIATTSFVNSKLLDLTEFNYKDIQSYEMVFDLMQKEIIDNYDYYYSDSNLTSDLSTHLLEVVNKKTKSLTKLKRFKL